MAYADIEPFGEHLQDIRHGQQMALTCNLNRDQKTHPAPFTAAEFMLAPPPQPAPPVETEEERYARIDREAFGL